VIAVTAVSTEPAGAARIASAYARPFVTWSTVGLTASGSPAAK
jgi:hypothetical protein